MNEQNTEMKSIPADTPSGWFKFLSEQLKDEPGASELISKMEARYGSAKSLNADDLLYWLYESIYSSMGWRKHHIEEGQETKASAELDEIEAAEKAVRLLKPYQLHQLSDPQGSI